MAVAAMAAEAEGGGEADAVSAEWLAAAVLLGASHPIEKVGGLLVVGLVWAVWELTRMPAWGSTRSGSRGLTKGRLRGEPDVRIVGSQLGGGEGRNRGAAAVFLCPREKEAGCSRLLLGPARSEGQRVGSK